MKTCKDCIHLIPYRDPDTKRIQSGLWVPDAEDAE